MDKNNASAPALPPPFPENWATMTGDEKYQFFANGYASTEGKAFESPEIAEKFSKRAQRFLDVIALKEPDEVPVYFFSEGFDLDYSGIKPVDLFYNHEDYFKASLKMHEDFDLDYSALTYAQSGKVIDTLGLKLIRWPGSEVNPLPDETSFQFIESEYMPDSDYDELIRNPEAYVLRKYLPTVCTKLQGLAFLPNAFNFVEACCYTGGIFGLSKGTPAREALDTFLSAADESADAMLKFIGTGAQITAQYGAPSTFGGISLAPFDLIGDTMRCTMGMMKDLFRHPDKVVAAAEALVPMAVQMAVQAAYVSRVPFVFIPLHKGADGFMSPAQFEKFYWPSLKAACQGIIDAGLIPCPFVEGSYNQRLDIMAADPLPKGRSFWFFDRTDMKAAKEKVGSWGAVAGNVPASLFKHASPQDMENYCKELIETCAPGGGFCLTPGAVIDHANAENVHAYLACGKKFGKY